jgi:ribosomal protein S18 acetylase RimI-like enzyme
MEPKRFDWVPSGYAENITIREATAADMPALLQFEQGVIAAERPFDDTIKPDPVHYYDLDKLISSPDSYLVVAVLNNKPIGCGYARISDSRHFVILSHYAYFGFMYVLPQHRGKGVNKLVMDALTAWAKNKGLTELRLEVYFENAAAIKAYEKAGFKSQMIEMVKTI